MPYCWLAQRQLGQQLRPERLIEGSRQCGPSFEPEGIDPPLLVLIESAQKSGIGD
jgi:hypothetical protein